MASGAPDVSDKRGGWRLLRRVVLGAVFTGMAAWILVDLDNKADEMAHESLHMGAGGAPPRVVPPGGIAVAGGFTEDFSAQDVDFTVQVTALTNVAAPDVRTFRDRDLCGDTVYPYASGGGTYGLSDSLVWLEGPTTGARSYETVTVLSNSGCSLWPRVVAVGIGTELTLQNYIASPEVFRISRMDGGTSISVDQIAMSGMSTSTYMPTEGSIKLDQPGLVQVQSLIRPWEIAFVLVTEHGYAGQSDWEGKVTFNGVPRGEHTIHAWHHLTGEQTSKVTIDGNSSGQILPVQFP